MVLSRCHGPGSGALWRPVPRRRCVGGATSAVCGVVRASTASGPYTPAQWDGPGVTAGFWNYGSQWWLVDPARGDYMARGKDGQFIYVDPGHDTVIVRQGRSLGAFQGRRLTTTDWVALFQALADRAATGR